MELKDTEQVIQKEEASERSHFREYLRITEIGAVIVLVVVGASYFAFRGSAPIVVNVPGGTAVVTNTPPPAKPVITEHFVVTNMEKQVGSAKENIATADPKIFKAPQNFKSFSYDASAGKIIALAGTCKDAYYALLIFKSTDDYRKDPARSYYNTAFPCPASGMVTLEVNLKDFNLPSGEYYLFIADQGNTGSWYNPR